jgi:hypothetical protein
MTLSEILALSTNPTVIYLLVVQGLINACPVALQTHNGKPTPYPARSGRSFGWHAMKSRFPGQCSCCGMHFRTGANIMWSTQHRKTVYSGCFDALPASKKRSGRISR